MHLQFVAVQHLVCTVVGWNHVHKYVRMGFLVVPSPAKLCRLFCSDGGRVDGGVTRVSGCRLQHRQVLQKVCLCVSDVGLFTYQLTDTSDGLNLPEGNGSLLKNVHGRKSGREG